MVVHSLLRVHRCNSSLSTGFSLSLSLLLLSMHAIRSVYTMVKLRQRITLRLGSIVYCGFYRGQCNTTIINSPIHNQLVFRTQFVAIARNRLAEDKTKAIGDKINFPEKDIWTVWLINYFVWFVSCYGN